MTFAKQLKILRTKMELSQSDFAKKVGASPTSIARWEQGHAPRERQKARILRLVESPQQTNGQIPSATIPSATIPSVRGHCLKFGKNGEISGTIQVTPSLRIELSLGEDEATRLVEQIVAQL